MTYKYKALTIYHYHDGPLVFSVCPWAERIGAEQIWGTQIAKHVGSINDVPRRFEVDIDGGGNYETFTEDDVDWSTVDRQ